MLKDKELLLLTSAAKKVENRIRNSNILWKDDRKSKVKFYKMALISNFLKVLATTTENTFHFLLSFRQPAQNHT